MAYILHQTLSLQRTKTFLRVPHCAPGVHTLQYSQYVESW